ncbi:hypothetical protein SDC9_106286 [bioreactor metagenome]|uniref:Uncharacterized protein n=1 Tax=bioreactor metagenome TaxID=1076179 RepID=A0A645BCL0_9ZZZZ
MPTMVLLASLPAEAVDAVDAAALDAAGALEALPPQAVRPASIASDIATERILFAVFFMFFSFLHLV